MATLFTAWDYDVTYLEFSAVIISLLGISLATLGKRIAWPFYFLSGALYGWLFVEFDLLGSATLQLVFMGAAIWGWFDWGRDGVVQSRVLSARWRAFGLLGVFVVWLIVTPVLSAIGAAATLLDGFVLVGSVAAQFLMVKGYVETWPMWVIVNVVGTYHYANQQLYFTAGFYFALLCVAGWGWWNWSRKESAPSDEVADAPVPAVGHGR
jgi:nicotinamide mononucleotide transporter